MEDLQAELELANIEMVGVSSKKEAFVDSGILETVSEVLRKNTGDELVKTALTTAILIAYNQTQKIKEKIHEKHLLKTLTETLGKRKDLRTSAIKAILSVVRQRDKKRPGDADRLDIDLVLSDIGTDSTVTVTHVYEILLCVHNALTSAQIKKLEKRMEASLSSTDYDEKKNALLLFSLLVPRISTKNTETLETFFRRANDRNALIRILAAECIGKIYAKETLKFGKKCECCVVATLRETLNSFSRLEKEVKTKTLSIVLDFLKDSPWFQNAAVQWEMTDSLIRILKDYQEKMNESEIIVKTIKCIEAVTRWKEDARQKIFETKTTQTLNRLLAAKNTEIVEETCRVVKTLSRSGREIRSRFAEANFLPALLGLLGTGTEETKCLVCEIVANAVVSQSSPMRDTIEKHIPDLAGLADSENTELQYRALFCIKNLLYENEDGEKEKILKELTYKRLLAFTEKNTQHRIVLEALSIVRNALGGSKKLTRKVLGGIGETRLHEILDRWINVCDELAEECLYIISNVSIELLEARKAFAGKKSVQKAVLSGLRGETCEKRTPALWLVGNMAHGENETRGEIARIFTDCRVKEALEDLRRTETDVDAKERIKEALALFTPGTPAD
ncbi:MAG: uncharacterized protein A8A55_1251 [Amphiamblys sp. WSBS2006]|nr:MAG: uncharacterized protein A8A55_1251 [Amphiamblys sp. WSBS2006]